MRLEIELVDGGRGGPAPDLPPVRITPPRRRRLDRFEWSVLFAFAAVSMWVLALDVWRVVFDGRVWTGTDGVYIVDQMQYLAWIKDASKHVLASNLFVLRDTPADYFNPAVVVSGGLTALGMAPWLSLLLWKPIAVIGFFFAVRGVRVAPAGGRVAAPRGARARLVLRLVHQRVRAVQRPRRPVPRLSDLGVRVQRAGARRDGGCAGRAPRLAAERTPNMAGGTPRRAGQPAPPMERGAADRE